MSYDYLVKQILIGDSGVGKTCLLLQFLEKKFMGMYELTIGVEFCTRFLSVDDVTLKLQICDTTGQESFKCITRAYYRSAAGALIVYDITNKSFNNVAVWIEEAKQNGNKTMSMILVGNKTDLETKRVITTEEGERLPNLKILNFLKQALKQAILLRKHLLLMHKRSYIKSKQNKLTYQMKQS